MSSAMSLTRDQLDGGQQFIMFAYRPFLIPFKSTPVLHQTALPNAEMIRMTVVIWGCKLKIVGSGRSSSA